MNPTTPTTQIRREQGFDVYVLRNDSLELGVVPELGARIISLKNLRSGREWMWWPEGGQRLFRNRLGDDFANSPLVGADECLPTIAPCGWQGRQLPDHGEVWSVPWSVDATAWKCGQLRTRVKLAISPFEMERAIELSGNGVRLSYRLASWSDVEERFLWAWHPLLRLEAGDELRLPPSTRALLKDAGWVDAVTSTTPANGCSKLFAEPVREGCAAIQNSRTGDRLAIEWDPNENNTLGLWLTRGGWHGHHHFAIEPTNGSPDQLAQAAEQKRCSVVPAHGTVSWNVWIRVGS